MIITVKLGQEHDESTWKTQDVDAYVVGHWACHGIFRYPHSTEPDSSIFTVTHIPSGRCLNSVCGWLTEDVAKRVVDELAKLGDLDTEEKAKAARADIICTVDSVVPHVCSPACSGWKEP